MRVDAYNKIAQLYQTSKTKSTTKINGVGKKDQVEISSVGKDFQIAKQALNKISDVRTDKVNDIKNRMEAGTYNMNAEEVANKLLERFYDESI